MTENPSQTGLTAEDVATDPIMGSHADAEAAFLAKLDAWLVYRQPFIGTAAEHKKRDRAEPEARFQLCNAAALLGWHIRAAQVQP